MFAYIVVRLISAQRRLDHQLDMGRKSLINLTISLKLNRIFAYNYYNWPAMALGKLDFFHSSSEYEENFI